MTRLLSISAFLLPFFEYSAYEVAGTAVSSSTSWQYFTPLSSITLTNSEPDKENIHSEYHYGNCRNPDKIFYTHVHLDHMDVLGKVIVRGWIDVIRIPTCILLIAKSYEFDALRNTAYNFQICVPRITYCHSQQRFKYFYYEWYIPLDMVGGMNWDLYFFGPAEEAWQ